MNKSSQERITKVIAVLKKLAGTDDAAYEVHNQILKKVNTGISKLKNGNPYQNQVVAVLRTIINLLKNESIAADASKFAQEIALASRIAESAEDQISEFNLDLKDVRKHLVEMLENRV